MKPSIEFASAVEGRQDRVAVFQYPEGLVAVVADGAGGIGGGAKAADAVVKAVSGLGWRASSAEWQALLERLDGEINPGETTAVVVSVTEAAIVGASVGDSEAWLFRPGSTVGLTDGQVRKPLLGSGSATPVRFALDVSGPGFVVVASDGLWKYSKLEQVADTLALGPPAAAAALIGLVRYASGTLPDDVGVVVVRIGRP